MRPFDHPNFECGFTCPVCKSSADRPVVLVGIPGTECDGNIEAKQVHAECWLLVQRMHGIGDGITEYGGLGGK